MATSTPIAPIVVGTVKNWKGGKGFGFITTQGGDVFCNVSQLSAELRRLADAGQLEGKKVLVDQITPPAKNGQRPSAVGVRRILQVSVLLRSIYFKQEDGEGGREGVTSSDWAAVIRLSDGEKVTIESLRCSAKNYIEAAGQLLPFLPADQAPLWKDVVRTLVPERPQWGGFLVCEEIHPYTKIRSLELYAPDYYQELAERAAKEARLRREREEAERARRLEHQGQRARSPSRDRSREAAEFTEAVDRQRSRRESNFRLTGEVDEDGLEIVEID